MKYGLREQLVPHLEMETNLARNYSRRNYSDQISISPSHSSAHSCHNLECFHIFYHFNTNIYHLTSLQSSLHQFLKFPPCLTETRFNMIVVDLHTCAVLCYDNEKQIHCLKSCTYPSLSGYLRTNYKSSEVIVGFFSIVP